MIFLYACSTIAHGEFIGNPNSDSFVPFNPLVADCLRATTKIQAIQDPIAFVDMGQISIAPVRWRLANVGLPALNGTFSYLMKGIDVGMPNL